MIQYIYFVKCPNCEDEHFDFFDEAKTFALGCLSKKPIITQTEVNRNDFGECTDSFDLGMIWSWEDMMDSDVDTEKAGSHILTKADLENVSGRDPEFDDLDNSVEVEKTADETSEISVSEESEETLKESHFGIYFNNDADRAEFKKLCDEIGLKTFKDLQDFMKETEATNETILTKLREYRAELGADFKIKEAYTDPETECIYNDNIECTNNEDCTDCPNNPKNTVYNGKTLKELVEEMEEGEDEVECTWCNDLFPKDMCRKEVDLGYLCPRCEAAIKSRGEDLTFRENSYWDFLDEDIEDTRTLAELVKDSINHLTDDLGKDPWADDFADDVIRDLENNYDLEVPEDPKKYVDWSSAVASEVSRQLNNQLDEDEAADYITDQSDRAWDSRYNDAIDDFFNEDFDEPVDFKDEESEEESIFDDASSLEDVAEILIKEEEKAIDQYEEAKEKITEVVEGEDADVVNELLDHIKEEEEEHVEELKGLLPDETTEDENETSEISVEEAFKPLGLCPECGVEKAFDHESGVCNNCGFML